MKTEPLRETLTDLKSAALFDALPSPLTEVETATLLDTMAKVKPKATSRLWDAREKRWRPSHYATLVEVRAEKGVDALAGWSTEIEPETISEH